MVGPSIWLKMYLCCQARSMNALSLSPHSLPRLTGAKKKRAPDEVPVSNPWPEESLRSCARCCRFRFFGGLLLAIRFLRLLRLSALADVDAALEERAVFNRDTRCDHVTRQRSVAPNIHPVARGKIAAHF